MQSSFKLEVLAGRPGETDARSMNRLSLLFTFSLALCSPLVVAQESQTLPLGASAPAFDLLGVDGRRWPLQDFAGARLLVVVFTCNHCPTAQYYEPRLK